MDILRRMGLLASISQEDKERLDRKCGRAYSGLSNCMRANASNLEACKNLDAALAHCQAEVLCPALAQEYQRCFVRVVNSKGKEDYRACDTALNAMKRCLRKKGVTQLL